MKHPKEIKQKIRQLRLDGNTYSEIQRMIDHPVAKSTIAYLCKHVQLPESYDKKITELKYKNLARARESAKISKQEKRESTIKDFKEKNEHLKNWLKQAEVAKIVLAVLYFAEGAKTLRGTVMFGNSDPGAISLFLSLLRSCYSIDEGKFRCTVQCRADQDEKKLKEFWSQICGIPLNRFYKSRIDLRTVGRPSRKVGYMGVLRIDYFSAKIDFELKQIISLLVA